MQATAMRSRQLRFSRRSLVRHHHRSRPAQAHDHGRHRRV
jgi:hypothetical protein